MFSGGKDSCYSIWIALHQAWDVAKLLTLKPSADDSLMFHYPNVEWTSLQAKSMGVEHQIILCGKDELASLENSLQDLKTESAIDGIVTGAISSDYQKTRFDNICEKVGLRSFSPLWHKKPELLIGNLIDAR